MKKFLLMFAIAGALVACNDSAEGTDAAADSARIADSVKRAQDSINAAMPVTPDTTNTNADTTNPQ
jgi:hypothetical protein